MGKLIDLNGKRQFSIKNRGEKRAEILIYDEIGRGDFFSEAISSQDFKAELDKLPKTVNQIDMRINSPGGDVFDGFAIYNLIKQHPAKFTAYIDGIAASIASVIAMAADEVIMGEASYIMVHNAWSGIYGNYKDFEQMSERLYELDEQIISIYSRKTKKDRIEVRSMVDATTYMAGEEAVELGFATSVFEQDYVIAACSLDKIKNLNPDKILQTRNKMVKNKLASFKKDIEKVLARK